MCKARCGLKNLYGQPNSSENLVVIVSWIQRWFIEYISYTGNLVIAGIVNINLILGRSVNCRC